MTWPTTSTSVLAALWIGLCVLSSPAARADDWPAKPVKLVIGWPACGIMDVLGRLLAQRLGKAIGQQVVVENRPGGSGTLGAAAVARAAPDGYTLLFGAYGPYGWSYAMLILCNGLIPQLLWSKKVRVNAAALFVISIVVNVGMWLERFVIVVTSLHRDFLPSSWDMYTPTVWDWMIYAGTIGVFLFLMFMFIRVMPMISIFELKHLLPWKGRVIDTSADAN